jgi:hypothetical protein
MIQTNTLEILVLRGPAMLPIAPEILVGFEYAAYPPGASRLP